MSEQKNGKLGELLRFAVSGGVSFVVEFIVLVLMRDTLLVNAMGVDNLVATRIATPVAFLVSVIVNYLMCLVWVFKGANNSGTAAKVGFMLTSLIGLVLNSLMMLLLGLLLGEDTVLLTLFGFSATMYMFNKCVSTGVVMIWNYFTKRAVLQSDLMARLLQKLGVKA